VATESHPIRRSQAPTGTDGPPRHLVRRVQEEARRRGCLIAHVHTFSTFGFQARGFYERLEYRVIGQRDEYAPGVTLHWLRKDLRKDL
jgi:GNAT superfamily N-acetyltransferase